MRRASSLIVGCMMLCLAWAAVAWAQQETPKPEAPPAAAPAAASPADAAPAQPAAEPAKAEPGEPIKPEPGEPIKPEPAKAEPEPAAAQPAASEPAASKPALDEATQAAIAEWAKKLKSRAQGTGLYLTIGDICQVKQYKQDKLQGFGLVLDLEAALGQKRPAGATEEEGTAVADTRLAGLLALLNAPTREGAAPPALPEALSHPEALTLAAVTATIPPEGVRKGDRIDCEVRPLGGKSISDGYLLVTQLSPPGPKPQTPAGLAAGPIVRESSYRTGPAKVAGGCLMQQDLCDEFVKDEKITLVLDEEHAKFPIAQDLVNLINAEMGVTLNQPLAKAPNRYNVEVTVPKSFADDPVAFVTLILRLETQIPAPEKEPERRTFGAPAFSPR